MNPCAFLRLLLPTLLATSCWSARSADADLFEHRGQHLFLTGVSLGPVQLLPFKGNPYGYSEAELKAKLTTAFAEMQSVGANAYRIWLHIDGSRSPLFQAQGVLQGLPKGLTADLQWMIATAYRDYGLLTHVTLWSHQVLAVRPGFGVAERDRVRHMISDADATKAYVDLAVTPLLQAMQDQIPGAGHQPVLEDSYSDAIAAWEVFNEPEATSKAMGLNSEYQFNMIDGEYSWHRDSLSYLRGEQRVSSFTDDGTNSLAPIHFSGLYFATDAHEFNQALYQHVLDPFTSRWDFLKTAILGSKTLTTTELPWPQLRRFIEQVSAGIHQVAPEAKVTVGARSVLTNGQLPLAALDFYQIHEDAGKDDTNSLFRQSKGHWQVPKPVVVDAPERDGGVPSKLTKAGYVQLYDQGYAGVWGWAYFVEREMLDPKTGQPHLYLDQHEGWQAYKAVLAGLPSRLRYPVQGSPKPKRIYAD